MAVTNSDKAWQAYGKNDPYFGVLTHDKYRDKNLTQENRDDFFQTGHKYAKRVFKHISERLDPNFNPESVLDFGCGTGRLAIGFAESAKMVVGIDISMDMLNEARKNADLLGHNHLEFHMSDDELSAVNDKQFDLVNCYIVLQHINKKRGYKIISKLIDKIKPGGFGVMQINYTCQKGRLGHIVDYFRYRIPLLAGIINMYRKRPYKEPLMQMNEYNLNKVYYILQKAGVKNLFVQTEAHGECWGITVYFQKPDESL